MSIVLRCFPDKALNDASVPSVSVNMSASIPMSFIRLYTSSTSFLVPGKSGMYKFLDIKESGVGCKIKSAYRLPALSMILLLLSIAMAVGVAS